MPTKQFNIALKTMPQLRVIIDEQKLIKPRTTEVSNAIKTVGMALWKREQKVKGNRWQEVQYKDLPPGQVFKFTRTRFKCDDALDVKPGVQMSAMRGNDSAMVLSPGMDQGSQIIFHPDRVVLTKGGTK